MKRIMTLCFFCIVATTSFAQEETFDLLTYTPPSGWKKEKKEAVIQFSKEDVAKGTYCLITLYKAVPGTASSKENFDLAWASLVKEMVTVSTAPEMQPASTENGWETQSGYAPFESDGHKGIALLVTASSIDKMTNLIILTNTDVYEKEMTSFLESISLKKQTQPAAKPPSNSVKNTQPVSVAKKDGFAFTITNFDDGWTSTVQEDWVEVSKGAIKVLLHYPKEGTIIPADPEPHVNNAWNILTAPRYSNLRNYRTAYIQTYNRPYLGMGTLTDNATGKDVFVVLFRQGQSGWMEFIMPDKNDFIQQYRFDPETIAWNSEGDLMNPLIQMANYNKFAIAASDFNGTWTSDFSGMQQLYNVYTGNYAGMHINQSKEVFEFNNGGTYKWNLLVVNGMVGSMNYAQVKSSGQLQVINNWQITCSDIEGKPKKYHAFFSCIKGARLLKLLDADYPGSGIFTVFGRK